MIFTPLKFFLITSLLFGCFYAVIIPPFQVPDEFNHFYRSWQISSENVLANNSMATQGVLTAVRTSDNRVGAVLPQSLRTISQPFRTLPFQLGNKTSKDMIFNMLLIPLENDKRTFFDFPNSGLYAPTAYVPQAFTISMLKKINCPPLYVFYATRFATLFVWILIVGFAIKTTPVAKWLIVFMALLPSSLFINSGNNADVISNALSFLIIAIVLKWLNEKPIISVKDLTILSIAVTILSLNKIVYSPLLFLILLVKKEKFGDFKHKMLFFSSICLVNLGIMAWWLFLIRPLQITYDEYNTLYRTILPQPLNEKVNHLAQLHFILEHPFQYTKILIYSLLKSSPHTLIHYLGKFGWEKNYLPMGINFTLFIVLLLRGVSEPIFTVEKKRLWLIKSVFMAIGLMMIVGVATFLYLNSCEVGSDFIFNLSGKYFIPIIPLFLLILPNVCLVKWSLKNRVMRLFLSAEFQASFIVFSLIYGAFEVIWRYYT
jgi:uncharacterized membrane protein